MLGTRVKKPFFFIIFIFCCICLSNKVFAISYDFAVIGDETAVPEVKNIYEMFYRTGISYKKLLPSQVTSDTVFSDVNAIVSFIHSGSTIPNPTAVINFANNHIVLSNGYDFANYYYPSYKKFYIKVSTSTVNYSMDWGNFRNGDQAEFKRLDNTLWVFNSSVLEGNPSITKIARYKNTYTAFFHMRGLTDKSGFYVMDLNATTNETEWSGIWHIFPVVKMVKDFPTGKYSRWMGNGTKPWDLTWINNRIDTLVNENSDIASGMVIGQSVQGRDINAIVIGKGNRYEIIDGCIHGNEKTGAFAALRVAELLIEYYRYIPSWQTKLNQYKVIIIPVLNPDGFVANIRENAHGKDLNRQFPPGGTTTEPETWALRNLIDNYRPVIYVNYHEGGCMYPKDVLYGAYQPESFKEFTRYSLKSFTSNEYNSLKHWLWHPNCTGYQFWAGSVSVYSSGIESMAVQYASKFQNTSSLLIESLAYSPRKSLWGLDFYPSITIGQLKHYDYDGNYLLISNGFISGISSTGDTLTISLNTSELISFSKSVIKDMRNRGRPIEVVIDGVKKNEGYGWSYDSDTKNITITGAINSISLNWGILSTSTTTSTTRPTTIPTSTTSTKPSTSTTRTTTTISGFTGTNFICNYVQLNNVWDCYLDYTNNLNERAVVNFHFIDSVTSEVKSTGTVWANIGSSGTVGSELSCNSYHGTYNVVWRAYKESDRMNVIVWSISPQIITCS